MDIISYAKFDPDQSMEMGIGSPNFAK